MPVTEENESVETQDAPAPNARGPGIYQIVEVGVLGTGFAIIYAFGILRFSQTVAMAWGPLPAIGMAMFGVVIAIGFIDAVSALINDTRKPRDDDKA
jgi:hypothetical protein